MDPSDTFLMDDAYLEDDEEEYSISSPDVTATIKRKRGRPSKPKQPQVIEDDEDIPMEVVKRPRGRPPGSGKKKLLESSSSTNWEESPPVQPKRPRGRPRKHPKDEAVNSSGDESTVKATYVNDSNIRPTDLEIAELIRVHANEFQSGNYTPIQVLNRLEDHFGVNLQYRLWYITEVYYLMSF